MPQIFNDSSGGVLYLHDAVPNIEKNANFNADEINAFTAYFQQFGGWWSVDANLSTPVANALDNQINVGTPTFEGEGEYILFPFVSPVMAEAGANKPWLQEIPDPTTTVTWNTWVEMNPDTADELGIENDDVVQITSPALAMRTRRRTWS